jgi:hypothetical protein
MMDESELEWDNTLLRAFNVFTLVVSGIFLERMFFKLSVSLAEAV